MSIPCPVCKSPNLKPWRVFSDDMASFVCMDCHELIYIPSSPLGTEIIKTIASVPIPSPFIPKFIEGIVSPSENQRCN